MSLIEDLSNPLSRLIVYLCLSLIGLKRELSPWSIQRREKSNHFSLRLSFFVHLFLSSSFRRGPVPSYHLFLLLRLFVFLTLSVLPHKSLHMSLFPPCLIPLSRTDRRSLPCLAPLFFLPSLAPLSISFGLPIASIFFTLQTNCNKPYIKSVTVSLAGGAAWSKSILCAYLCGKTQTASPYSKIYDVRILHWNV